MPIHSSEAIRDQSHWEAPEVSIPEPHNKIDLDIESHLPAIPLTLTPAKTVGNRRFVHKSKHAAIKKHRAAQRKKTHIQRMSFLFLAIVFGTQAKKMSLRMDDRPPSSHS